MAMAIQTATALLPTRHPPKRRQKLSPATERPIQLRRFQLALRFHGEPVCLGAHVGPQGRNLRDSCNGHSCHLSDLWVASLGSSEDTSGWPLASDPSNS